MIFARYFYLFGRKRSLSGEIDQPMLTELYAASLRADKNDVKAFLDVLAVKLEGSLPDHTKVTRMGSIFSRERPTKEIIVSLGEYQYRIGREKQGFLMAARGHMVRGIILKTEQISVEQWIDELSEALAQLASQSAQSRVALQRFLIQ
jgi:hypothetical protein